ncbi:MAG: hypothetical protein ACT4O9_14170 [Blastocatellia bacterium]
MAFVWGAVNQYWNGRLPTAPDESTGRIYVLHFHGTDGYANGTEIAIFWGLPFAALGLAIVVDMIDRYLDKKNKNAK